MSSIDTRREGAKTPGAGIADFDDPTFDPFAADEAAFGDISDTYERLERLRRAAPVQRGDVFSLMGLTPNSNLGDTQQFTVLGYKEVAQINGDPETYSNDAYQNLLGLTFGKSLTVMNPPEHSRYRRIFQRAFLPGIVNRWGDSLVAPVVNALIDRFATRGCADLVTEFAMLYPFQIIYRQLELPEADIATFHKLAVAQTLTINELTRYGREAAAKLGDYFRNLIAERRQRPGEGLIGLLVEAEVDGERLPEDVIISFLRQLINAAGDTTYRSTGTMLVGLLSSPEQYAEVCASRSLVASAIEETLRWDGPVVMVYRTAVRNTTLGGIDIPAGATLGVIVGAANRDPEIFPNPDRFDIHRHQSRHFAFGYGPHVCIGQHLARLEMTRALNAIMDRLPNLRLDPDRPPPVVRGGVMRTPREVFVRFG
jgi:cytochrome P450